MKIRSFHITIFFLLYTCSFQATTLTEFTSGRLQQPLFEAAPKAYLSGNEILQSLRPILRRHLIDTNYDRVGVAMQLIDYFHNEIVSLSDIAEFTYKTHLRNERGGPCVGLTLDILSKIPKEMNAYVVAAILPKKYHQFAAPQFCHTAVLIAFENPADLTDSGYVLLDPSFDLAEPIILYHNSTDYIYQEGSKSWVFALDNDMIQCQIYPRGISVEPTPEEIDRLRMIYRTDRLINPVESSATPMALIDRRLSLLARDSNGKHTGHLNIELDKEQIVWNVHEERRKPILFREYVNKEFIFDDTFASFLSISPQDLNEDILYVLKNKNVLAELYIQYLELIQKTEDYSIVGSIDLVRLRSIIDKYRNGAFQ